ncbi:thiamine phosphate synthase [Planctomicrobium piriforme]|uniref:Thiamine-phosphate synthase n=1 Tax=Planctomicrobium piriforme TaxID=1576369 RepID=A0A1I3BAZ6_9PLAN|nr:thiamine phosphate synthase [Planctomicrobium piriforme]SFH59473.1 thiamine-phosphate pyrophosphorylase [Planctomicrobium piriforme]
MSFLHLTAGAERALIRIRQNASEESAETTLFAQLLLGLLEDEGHAAEILRVAAVGEAALQTAVPAAAQPLVPVLEWQRNLVRRADQFAIELSTDGITGTEHLLLAAIDLDPYTAELLGRFQLTKTFLIAELSEAPEELHVSDAEFVQIRPAEQGQIEAAALARILDASANRCREGLRVIEDYVRFHLDDALLQRELKQIRHTLTQTLRYMGQSQWIPSRDSLRDVGPLGALASERARESLMDVLRASFKRVEEALRSLEEYGKLIDAELAVRISECRYRIYTVEKALETVVHNRQRLEQCRLYLLVTAANCRYTPEIVIRNTLEKGVDVVQIREKDMPDRELIAYGRKVREWTTAARALLIINDRPDIAAAVGADGVHLGQDDMDVASARRVLGGSGIIGVSTHSPEQARTALFDGADYLGVGPVFVSQTKEFPELAGLDYVQQAAVSLTIPWFAIGGITPDNLREVQFAGATRVAVSSSICQAPDPRGVTAEIAGRLRSAAEAAAMAATRNPPQ